MPDSTEQFGPRFREPKKSNRTCLIIGLILGGVIGIVLLCGGCGVGMYYFGARQIASGVQSTLAQNPVIQAHIGDIQSLELNLMATSKRGGGDMFVFDVTGSKGSGTIIAECIQQPGGAVDVVSGELELANGEVFPLFTDGPEQ